MIQTSLLARRARRLLASSFACAAAVAAAHAQTSGDLAGPAIALDRFVISASRTPQDARQAPSSVTVLPLRALQHAQVADLATALSQQPGLILLATGAVGAQSSVSLRGAASDQTLFLVDGVRMNDRAADYLNFLGAADLAGIDRIEVLRGPQSTLYGSSAMGGVVLIDTLRGTGPAAGAITATGGSFDTFGAAVSASGAQDGFSYSGSLGHYETANDRPHNGFRQRAGSTRLECTVAPDVRLGATFRGVNADYEEPGSRSYPADGDIEAENMLVTAYGEVRRGDSFASRLTLAAHRRKYTWTGGGFQTHQSNRREILDWQATWAPADAAEIVVGANCEAARFTVNGAATSDRVAAGFVSATLRPGAAVTLTGGARHDRYRSAGEATTGRFGAAWAPVAHTRLHATIGTGFNAPASSDRYGVPDWGQLPSPALVPEESTGWDVGVEREFSRGAALIDVTYFQNRFRNLFDWEYQDFVTFQGRTVNRRRASTRGVEVAATARPIPQVRLRAGYTYLEARDDETGARLTRRPRHVGDGEVQVQPTDSWILGAGVHLVASNIDGPTPFAGYTTVRVFASHALRPNLLLKVRVENALDRQYEEVLGYPALPGRAFGGVEWRF